jgi:hypothetical protein
VPVKRFSADIWAHAAFDPGTLTAVSVGSGLIGGGISLFGGQQAKEADQEGAALSAQGLELAAEGTLAAGDAALQAGVLQKASYDYEAAQDTDNASTAFAAGQRQMLADNDKTRLAISTARAAAAGNGTNVAVGSPSSIIGSIARRGSYNAAMDMFNGASAATGLRNKAAGETFSGDAALFGGEEQQQASRIQAQAQRLQAQATLASGKAAGDAAELSSFGSAFGSFGSAAKTYGSFAYPSIRST